MLDFSAIPVKLGEPKRLAALGFGLGALIVSTAVKENMGMSLFLFGMGIVSLSMTIAGYLNPVNVSPGPSPTEYNANPMGFGNWKSTGVRNVATPMNAKGFYKAYGTHGAVAIGNGYITNNVSSVYGADVIIPAGPATLKLSEVNYIAAPASPMYLNYVTGTENEGKIIGQ